MIEFWNSSFLSCLHFFVQFRLICTTRNFCLKLTFSFIHEQKSKCINFASCVCVLRHSFEIKHYFPQSFSSLFSLLLLFLNAQKPSCVVWCSHQLNCISYFKRNIVLLSEHLSFLSLF